MFVLKRFQASRLERLNTVVSGVHRHLTQYINLVGSATLPLPEVCEAISLPGSAIRTEGHLGSRFFPGTKPIDDAELIAMEGVKRLFEIFGGYQVSVQPHSATQANHIVWNSLLDQGDKVLGLSLNDGGHLSHTLGLPKGITFLPFPMGDSGIAYSELKKMVIETQPKMLVAGATSYTLAIDYVRLASIAKITNSYLHADIAHTAPYVFSGQHPNVIPGADTITLDTGKNLRGPKGGVLVYRTNLEKKIKRSIFPLVQSSLNQSAIIAKACVFEYWDRTNIKNYAIELIRTSKYFAEYLKTYGVPLIFEGTDTHLILMDVGKLGLSGKEAEERLEKYNILSNRNTIPGDARPAWIGSGLRIGTTVLTILGYSNEDLRVLARIISEILNLNTPPKNCIELLLKKYHSSASVLV